MTRRYCPCVSAGAARRDDECSGDRDDDEIAGWGCGPCGVCATSTRIQVRVKNKKDCMYGLLVHQAIRALHAAHDDIQPTHRQLHFVHRIARSHKSGDAQALLSHARARAGTARHARRGYTRMCEPAGSVSCARGRLTCARSSLARAHSAPIAAATAAPRARARRPLTPRVPAAAARVPAASRRLHG